jgi:hypothetical protein
MDDGFLLPFEVETNEVWERSQINQKLLTVPADSDFEVGEELAIIRKDALQKLVDSISEVDLE